MGGHRHLRILRCFAHTRPTFEYETERLAESGALWWSALNVITSALAGFAAVQLGFLARR
jgi:fluoride ion exporter CrcB/FEX